MKIMNIEYFFRDFSQRLLFPGYVEDMVLEAVRLLINPGETHV